MQHVQGSTGSLWTPPLGSYLLQIALAAAARVPCKTTTMENASTLLAILMAMAMRWCHTAWIVQWSKENRVLSMALIICPILSRPLPRSHYGYLWHFSSKTSMMSEHNLFCFSLYYHYLPWKWRCQNSNQNTHQIKFIAKLVKQEPRWPIKKGRRLIPSVSVFCNPRTVARFHTIPEQGKITNSKQSIPEQHGFYSFNPIFNP